MSDELPGYLRSSQKVILYIRSKQADRLIEKPYGRPLFLWIKKQAKAFYI